MAKMMGLAIAASSPTNYVPVCFYFCFFSAGDGTLGLARTCEASTLQLSYILSLKYVLFINDLCLPMGLQNPSHSSGAMTSEPVSLCFRFLFREGMTIHPHNRAAVRT
jgi:hypothetical protein